MRLFTAILLYTSFSAHADTTPLTQAIRLEDFAEAKKHITPELVNKSDSGLYHPLIYAVYTGNYDLVEQLLKGGANPNTVEHNGKTAIYVATNLGHLDIIKLLGKHHAKPNPTKFALSPVRAAVTGNSVRALQLLIKQYPKIDLDAGWGKVQGGYFTPDRQIGRAVESDYHLSPLNYAVYHGYNEIALTLLDNSANPQIHDSFENGRLRINALHHAASNALCSADVVKALLKTGLDPFSINYSPLPDYPNHGHPSSALEMAASTGSMDKLKLMLEGANLKKHTTNISRAAYNACFYNNTAEATYLFKLIERPTPSIQTFLNRETKTNDVTPKNNNQTGKNTTTSLEKFLPKTKRSPRKELVKGSLAIISPPELRNTASLLTAQLANKSGITLTERDAISNIIQEKSLQAFQDTNSDQLHRQLELIPAENLLIISPLKSVDLVRFALINTSNGITMAIHTLPFKKANTPDDIQLLASSILQDTKKSSAVSTQAVALTYLAIKPSLQNERSVRMSQIANTLIPLYINETEGCVLLSRTQMQHLETEKAIGIQGAYWSASWVIDGEIDFDGTGNPSITLRAKSPQRNKDIIASTEFSAKDIATGVTKTWHQLASKIKLAKATNARPDTITVKESQILLDRSGWLLRAGYVKEAKTLANTCIALGNDNRLAREIVLRASIKLLPTWNASKYYHLSPRALHPAHKYPLAQHYQEHINLAHHAIEYVSRIKNKVGVTIQGKVGVTQSETLTYIKGALRQLHTYRIAMDDTIIHATHSEKARYLDTQIKHLTKAYLPKLDPKFHISSFVTTDHGYHDRIAPDLIPYIYKETINLSKKQQLPYAFAYLPEHLIASKLRNSYRRAQDNKVYLSLLAKIKPSKIPHFQLCYHTALLAINSEPHHQKKHLRKIVSLNTHASNNHPAFWITDQAERLLGCENPYNHHFSSLRLPKKHDNQKDVLSCAIHPKINLSKQSSEYMRLYGLYRWFEKLNLQSDDTWHQQLSNYLNSHLYRDKTLSDNDLKTLRYIALSTKKTKAKTANLFKKALPETLPDSDKHQSFLTLSSPLIIRPANRENHSAFHVCLLDSLIINDHLWILSGQQLENNRQPDQANYQISAHVISLTNGKQRIVPLPKEFVVSPAQTVYPSQKRGYRFYAPTRSSPLKRLLQSKNHVFIIQHQNFGKHALFSIDKRTLKLRQIELPLERIRAMDSNRNKNTVFMSLVPNGPHTNSRKENVIVEINGEKVIRKIIASHRTPPQSPLDDPNTNIVGIHQSDKNVYFVGNGQTKEYDPDNRSWGKSMSYLDGNVMRMKQRLVKFLENKQIRHKNKLLHLSHYGSHKPGNIILTDTPLAMAISGLERHYSLSRIENQQFIHYVPIQTKPLNDPKFNVKQFLTPTNNPSHSSSKPKLQSANDLIRNNGYYSYVIGKWKGKFLIGLHQNHFGFPAVWAIKENELYSHIIAHPSP